MEGWFSIQAGSAQATSKAFKAKLAAYAEVLQAKGVVDALYNETGMPMASFEHNPSVFL